MQEHKCCPDGSWPALKTDYKPKGNTFNLAGTTVYHVGEGHHKALIIISDIFGATSARHQSVADTYSQFGYNVYLPQILVNPYNPETSKESIVDNIKNQNWEKMQYRFKALHEYIHGKGIKQFYAIGFCWGVWAGFKFASKYQGFKAFVGFHPSFGICGMFGESQSALMDSVKCPAFFCPASNDPENIKQGGEHVEHLKKRFGQAKVGTHTFPEQVHGWVVRGDVSQPAVHKDVELALKLSKEYFSKF